MASKLDICNIALANIGCLPIVSLNDGSDSARLMQLNYDRCLESVLREFPWKFATVTDVLATADDPHPGYRYAYAYPYECLRVCGVFDSDLKRKQDYDIRLAASGEYKIIVTDEREAVVQYIKKVNDTTLYSPSFVEALAYDLSYEINNAKTGNAQQTSEMQERYVRALEKAKHDDVIEMKKPFHYPNDYEKARR